jgi:hypothetical protein
MESMGVFSFKIDKELVEKGLQVGEPFVRVSNSCPCGCAPYAFVSLSDGMVGVTAQFTTEQELDKFKRQVRVLEMPWADNCRYCQHLVDKRPPRTRHYIGGCEFDLSPDSCGKYTLSSLYEGKPDPRIRH